jgi:hypothetical protein
VSPSRVTYMIIKFTFQPSYILRYEVFLRQTSRWSTEWTKTGFLRFIKLLRVTEQ